MASSKQLPDDIILFLSQLRDHIMKTQRLLIPNSKYFTHADIIPGQRASLIKTKCFNLCAIHCLLWLCARYALISKSEQAHRIG